MEELNIYAYLSILRRRKFGFFVVAALLFAASSLFAASWSNYLASATIQVQAPDIPEGMTLPLGVMAATFVENLVDQRIEQIRQKVTSTASLVDIITKFDLYSSDRRTKQIADIADVMRKKIKLDLINTDAGGGAAMKLVQTNQSSVIAFTLSFTYQNAGLAQQVANELVTRFLDEDLKERRAESKGTAAFLGSQIEALEQSMAEQEKKIAAFNAQHPDSRPASLPFNQQMAATTAMASQEAERQLAMIDRNRGDLRAQLANTEPYTRVLSDGQVLTTPATQLKALQAKYAVMSGQYGPDHPDMIKLRHQIDALQAEVGQPQDTAAIQSQMADVQTNLAATQNTYGPKHPDVIALRRQLTGLQAQAAKATTTPHMEVKQDADNPAYLMLVAQLQSTEQQYKTLSAQLESLREQHDHYQGIIAGTPAVEQEFAALSRDYDNSQVRYRELKEKKLSADMSEQVDQGRIGQRLEVVDPPELPTATSPSRTKLLLIGAALSIVGGGGWIGVTEALNRSVRGVVHLSRLVGAPPLVVIPHIFTIEEKRQTRRFYLRLAIALTLFTIAFVIVIDQFIMPLDVIWSVIANRLGLA